MPGRNPSNEPLGGFKRLFSKEAPRQVERPGRITAASEELIHKETMNKSGSGRRRFSWFLLPNFLLRWFHRPSAFPHGPSNRSSDWGYHMGYQGVDSASIIEVSLHRVLDFFMDYIFQVLSSWIHVSSMGCDCVNRFCVSLCLLNEV